MFIQQLLKLCEGVIKTDLFPFILICSQPTFYTLVVNISNQYGYDIFHVDWKSFNYHIREIRLINPYVLISIHKFDKKNFCHLLKLKVG